MKNVSYEYTFRKAADNNSDKIILLRNQLVTIGDLQDFRMQLLKDFKQLMSQTATISNKPWLKSGEVRKLLNISPGTLQNLRINGVLSYTKVGGIIFYAYADLEKVLETNKVEATPNLFNPKWLVR